MRQALLLGGNPAPALDDATTAGEARLSREVPLVVDLDGTLIRTDSLVESLFVLVKQQPLLLLALPFWLLHGKAALKHRIAVSALPDVRTLPYHAELLEHLSREKDQGRRAVLATAADERIARAVARELGVFDAVFASDGTTNLSGEAKRARLVAAFGERGYDYAGAGPRDVPAWRSARRAILVSPSPALAARVAEVATVERVLGDGPAGIATYLRELRWHHWLKNLLVFVPLLAAHRLADPQALIETLLAFAGLCLTASCIYLLDDLVDLPRDRRHPGKKDRPIASGRIPATQALLLLPALLLAAAGIALALSFRYTAVLGAYFVLMLAYVLRLRDLRIADAVTLGCGYTLRVLAGSAATGIAVSPWLIACCLPLFFGLALLKRNSELALVGVLPGAEDHTHAYREGDGRIVEALGRTAGIASMAVLAAYPLVDPGADTASWPIWCICVLLVYWMERMWRLSGQGRIHDDPVLFALRDHVSEVVGVGVVVLLLATQ